ncbi:hypothetical protein ACQEPB_05840 [Novosphingobium fluoreni]|uniref:hypothetical protein n=1 Tax=Novosphingobium fluoreni TaxID=1391222 RepID=UPI003DA0F603
MELIEIDHDEVKPDLRIFESLHEGATVAQARQIIDARKLVGLDFHDGPLSQPRFQGTLPAPHRVKRGECEQDDRKGNFISFILLKPSEPVVQCIGDVEGEAQGRGGKRD